MVHLFPKACRRTDSVLPTHLQTWSERVGQEKGASMTKYFIAPSDIPERGSSKSPAVSTFQLLVKARLVGSHHRGDPHGPGYSGRDLTLPNGRCPVPESGHDPAPVR